MALVYTDMPCSLCRRAIRAGEVYVACAHFIYDPSDPLMPQSDSAMHRSCFDAWEHREEFARRYRAFWARKGVTHDWPESETRVMLSEEELEALRRGT